MRGTLKCRLCLREYLMAEGSTSLGCTCASTFNEETQEWCDVVTPHDYWDANAAWDARVSAGIQTLTLADAMPSEDGDPAPLFIGVDHDLTVGDLLDRMAAEKRGAR